MLGGAAGEGRPNVFRLALTPSRSGATLTARRGPGDDSPVTFTLAGSERRCAPRRRSSTIPPSSGTGTRPGFDEERAGGRVRLSPVPATLLFAAAGGAALLTDRLVALGVLAAALLVVVIRAPAQRRLPYLFGAVTTGLGVFVVSPLVAAVGYDVLWEGGPTIPVLGQLDVTTEELRAGALNGLRLATLGLAFSAYALVVDHDRLVATVSIAPRSALAVALATRLVPSLERDAAGLVEAVRGRGVRVHGARGYARLLSPLVAGSLERATNLAEAMEARGFGHGRRSRAPERPWSGLDRAAVAGGLALLALGALWL